MAADAALTPDGRGAAMVGRVHATLMQTLGAWAADPVAAVVEAAITRRADVMHEDDVRFLHPGRTVLILVADVELADPAGLAAAAALETLHPDVALDEADLHARAGRFDDAAAAWWRAVPRPDGSFDALREALVTAEPVARSIALAERLDHARHLHLYADEPWRPFHAEIGAAYLPVAEWVGGLLGRRYRRWYDAFQRRMERAGR